jgi:hypothetical protein
VLGMFSSLSSTFIIHASLRLGVSCHRIHPCGFLNDCYLGITGLHCISHAKISNLCRERKASIRRTCMSPCCPQMLYRNQSGVSCDMCPSGHSGNVWLSVWKSREMESDFVKDVLRDSLIVETRMPLIYFPYCVFGTIFAKC